MSENVQSPAPFEWTKKRHLAAQLLAEDELSDIEIGTKVGINPRQLYRWRQHPEFAARVADIARKIGNTLLRISIAKRTRRVRTLEQRWLALQKVIAERAADPSMTNVPGGTTGLLVRRQKGLGSGENFRVVDEYEVDTATLKELREHEKQAAIELGQWAEKTELSGPDGGSIPIAFVEFASTDEPSTDGDRPERP